jgi:hypothetical protein
MGFAITNSFPVSHDFRCFAGYPRTLEVPGVINFVSDKLICDSHTFRGEWCAAWISRTFSWIRGWD